MVLRESKWRWVESVGYYYLHFVLTCGSKREEGGQLIQIDSSDESSNGQSARTVECSARTLNLENLI